MPSLLQDTLLAVIFPFWFLLPFPKIFIQNLALTQFSSSFDEVGIWGGLFHVSVLAVCTAAKFERSIITSTMTLMGFLCGLALMIAYIWDVTVGLSSVLCQHDTLNDNYSYNNCDKRLGQVYGLICCGVLMAFTNYYILFYGLNKDNASDKAPFKEKRRYTNIPTTVHPRYPSTIPLQTVHPQFSRLPTPNIVTFQRVGRYTPTTVHPQYPSTAHPYVSGTVHTHISNSTTIF